MTTNIFAFVIVLGVLIFFHELGHFLTARMLGVGVLKFSLGFGPRLFGKKIGITDYCISAVPLGGFVKMVGEEPDAEIDPADIPISFTHKNVFQRILIVAAGPFFNLILALIIFYLFFQFSGVFILKPVIGEVEKGSPAQIAGLKKDDTIAAIDGIEIVSWNEMSEIISSSKERNIEFSVVRGESLLEIKIKPRMQIVKDIFGEDKKRSLIGIKASGDYFIKELNPVQAFSESIIQTYSITKLTVVSIVKIIQGTISTKTLGGPIMIAELAGQQAREGAANLAFFIALLSINLAILNILPIPVLDGGHILFFFIEAVTRRPINTKVREIAQQAGIFLLILLMIVVFYNDITRLFFNQSN